MDGDCFEVAGRIITDTLLWEGHGLEAPALIHATITGQGPIEGMHHTHAWVEYNRIMEWPDGQKHPFRMAMDKSNGKDLELPSVMYRQAARIIEIRAYTPEEARRCIIKHKHWGPWEDDDGRSEGDRKGQRLRQEEEDAYKANQKPDPRGL